ncbi:hypothetical protein, partial [Mesorhizobium sp. M1A.T.Ca.IN.004.03.1.1]|uniref:hypothetical protein n=1 Tax=Mesorhizobium sp. M1A.T.Ca.IN.004.03.1.1 TaxID=2496795 RepID=UPI0019D10B0C
MSFMILSSDGIFRLIGFVSSRKSKLVSNSLVWNDFKNRQARLTGHFDRHLLEKPAAAQASVSR